MRLDSLAPVLGIESSCDETAAAILAADGAVLAEAVLSQAEHAAFGGVVPEIAARAHLAHLPGLVRRVLDGAGLAVDDLGGVAATTGPGLIGGLIVGSGVGKGIALAAGLPFVAVNHLEAHALTARLTDGLAFPYLLLLVSGGHCQCVVVEGVGRYRRLGGTIDDAVGEAFDKVAKRLGLPWPGGPALERLAAAGDPARYAFPRPLRGRPGVRFQLFRPEDRGGAVGRRPGAGRAAGGGGGGCGGQLSAGGGRRDGRPRRARAGDDAGRDAGGGRRRGGEPNAARHAAGRGGAHGVRLVAPPLRLCGDNAVMVAWAGIERLRLGLADPLATAPRPRWPLQDMAGPGDGG